MPAQPKLIYQGAEAKIFLSNNFIIKDRISKGYRIPELDKKIIKRRTKKEAKLLTKSSKIISSPKPFFIPQFSKIKMPYIKGKKLSDYLDNLEKKQQQEVCLKIGKQIAILHNNNIMHGDLTTSNMILKNNKIYFIDFGLGFHSTKIEDRAVDLHLIKQALEAKHWNNWKIYWKIIENSYRKTSSQGKEILERLKVVESRGRYKKH